MKPAAPVTRICRGKLGTVLARRERTHKSSSPNRSEYAEPSFREGLRSLLTFSQASAKHDYEGDDGLPLRRARSEIASNRRMMAASAMRSSSLPWTSVAQGEGGGGDGG
jgi:hypothetical protein